MANLWRKFKKLIKAPSREVVTVQTVYANGTSKCITYTGGIIIVRGDSVQAGNKAFIEEGRIAGEAPDLTYYEIEV